MTKPGVFAIQSRLSGLAPMIDTMATVALLPQMARSAEEAAAALPHDLVQKWPPPRSIEAAKN